MVTENELISRGYLTTFFLDIDQLRNSLSGYRSIILRLNINTAKPIDAQVGIDEQTKNALIQWSDSVRNSVERCHISYKALIGTFPNIESKKITAIAIDDATNESSESTKESSTILDKLYEEIIKYFCADVNKVAEYTFEIHRCFIKCTLHEIMNKMNEFYQQYTQK